MANINYEHLVLKEKQIYVGDNPSASIPKIFTYWASKYLSPRLHDMFGTAEIVMFFVLEIERVAKELKLNQVRILSLGSGECSLEIDIAEKLATMGIDYKFICSDISPGMIEAAKKSISLKSLSHKMQLVECDININFPDVNFDIVIANHCIHHFLNLEYIFESIKSKIGNGAFIISDMIGRNGHMRWPETLEFVEAFWRILPASKRYDCINCVQRDLDYVNYNCAEGTFEGIRSQDIMPLLTINFAFDRFLGFGGIPDIFLDRMYGHNFDSTCAEDLAFVDTLELINDKLTKSGYIKPTMMFATARVSTENCIYDPVHPTLAVRQPNQ